VLKLRRILLDAAENTGAGEHLAAAELFVGARALGGDVLGARRRALGLARGARRPLPFETEIVGMRRGGGRSGPRPPSAGS
jgi:hypothetical protein